MYVQFTDVVLNMGNVGDFVASFFVDLSTIYAGTFTAVILVLFRVKGIVMPAKKKGSSATTRNERRRELRKSFKKKVKVQELKIVKLEQTVTQLRKSQRLKRTISTSQFLPEFPCSDVQHLSAGSVMPLLNHPARGMIISIAP